MIAVYFTAIVVCTVLVAGLVYYWQEMQYHKNELDWYKTNACGQPITNEEQMRINLNKLANELTELEGGNVNLTVAQVKDVLAALGDRWRNVSPEQAASEFASIVERAGLRDR